MKNNRFISIAVDGPVGAGKSTLCNALARRLGIVHLDTGAMYRAFGLYVLRHQDISPDDEEALGRLIREGQINIGVSFEGDSQITFLNGDDVTKQLRGEAIGAAASAVSRFPAVRRYLVSLQQNLAKERSLLIDGRDIGTVVLPDAKVKIFLTASVEDRALRRFHQLIDAGIDADYSTVLKDLIARDEQDQNRQTDPLRPAQDAIILDTTNLKFEESLQKMLAIVCEVYEQN
ncbi:MAG TPA: (d)CMP kinase [Clostridia bacterium]|jgi:cytidylate kinase|nr:(d)CMP kinase [Clostridia bacterium]HPY43814.1 (d)CMP kinase [Clostridia bacterium]HQA97125.1 (d)CMP kinase [Clostridia bacterium]HQO56380.1 (d)CMP kinase [Clostridia bacterium]HUM61763.1 (d)CMP kinase [Clostridia bacterium]